MRSAPEFCRKGFGSLHLPATNRHEARADSLHGTRMDARDHACSQKGESDLSPHDKLLCRLPLKTRPHFTRARAPSQIDTDRLYKAESRAFLHFPAKPKSSNLIAMSDIPPKRTPETPYEAPESGSGLVAMYNAASHANAESFPVLKAFQDYIEAERTQARKRVMQLSVFFAVLMGVVVTGFLTAGIFMLRNMSDVQTKLLDVALAAKESHAPYPQPVVLSAPAAPAPSSLFEASVREISQATTELRASLDKKMNGVNDIAASVHDRVAAQESELEKLRVELKNIQAQNERLNLERNTPKSAPPPVPARPPAHVAAVTPAAPPAARTKPAAVPAGKTGHAAVVPALGAPQAASLPKQHAAVQQPAPSHPAAAETVPPPPPLSRLQPPRNSRRPSKIRRCPPMASCRRRFRLAGWQPPFRSKRKTPARSLGVC